MRIYFFVFASYVLLRYLLEPFVKKRNPRPPSPGEKSGLLSLLVMVITHLVSAVAACVLLFSARDVHPVLFVSGVLLGAGGFAGRFLAIRTMGRSYSTFIQPVLPGALVTRGMYSVVRHPLYLMYLLEMAGFVLVAPGVITACMLAAYLPAIVYRIPREEKALELNYGKEFESYRNSVKCLIPFIV